MMILRMGCCLLILLWQTSVNAKTNHAHLLGVSQGISNPSSTSTLHYSAGFTSENPVGVIYQNNLRLTGQLDTGNADGEANGVGAEVGFGNGTMGIAGGYYDRTCDGCDGSAQGAVGLAIGAFSLGVGFSEDLYSAGMIINPQGRHRFGLMASLNDEEGDNNNITAFGVGYTFRESRFAFSLDASTVDFEDDLVNDDAIAVSPGLALFFNRFSFTLTYETYLEDNSRDDNLWFGLGIGDPGQWYVTAYHDYVNEWAFTGTIWF